MAKRREFNGRKLNVATVPRNKSTGCQRRATKVGRGVFPAYEDALPIIPRDEWPDRITEREPRRQTVDDFGSVLDQDGEGSCASNATAQSAMDCLFMECGIWVDLSAMSIYKRVGTGPDSGSTIEGNLKTIQLDGILPLNTPKNKAIFAHTHPAIGYDVKLPSGWRDTAKHFKAEEAWDIVSMSGFVSAILNGFTVVYGRGGHAICAFDVHWDSGLVVIEYCNSWGNWGDNGFGLDDEDYVAHALPYYGAWALRTISLSSKIVKLLKAA